MFLFFLFLKILKLEADANNSPFTNVSLGDKVRSVKLSKGGRLVSLILINSKGHQ